MTIKIAKEKELGDLDADTEIKALQQEIVKITAPHTQITEHGNHYKNRADNEHKVIKK